MYITKWNVMNSKKVLPLIVFTFFLMISNIYSENTKIIDISKDLLVILNNVNAPGLIARRIDKDIVTVSGVAGLRDRNQKVKMTDSDALHYGSMFKVQTATLCGIMVSNKIFTWDALFLEYVPEKIKKQFLETDYRWGKVTLKGFLSMSSGLDDEDFWNDERLNKIFGYVNDTVAGRKYILQQLSEVKLRAEQGKRYSYSNIGYTMAGYMIENAWNRHKRQAKSYEELMKERLFEPLKITSATLGAPGLDYHKAFNVSAKKPTPIVIGHNMKNNYPVNGLKIGEPVGLGYKDADNPLSISPAGTWAMCIDDYLKLLNIQMQTKQTEVLNRIGLNIKELKMIRKPVIEVPGKGFSFSLGWGVDNNNNQHLVYTGSNQRWVSKVDVDLKHRVGLVAVVNQGGEGMTEIGSKATSSVLEVLRNISVTKKK